MFHSWIEDEDAEFKEIRLEDNIRHILILVQNLTLIVTQFLLISIDSNDFS